MTMKDILRRLRLLATAGIVFGGLLTGAHWMGVNADRPDVCSPGATVARWIGGNVVISRC